MKMKSFALALCTFVATASYAETPTATSASTAKPKVTALCKDGTNFSGDSKSGACSGHQGVKNWTTADVPKVDTKADTKPTATKTVATEAAPGGGAGKVWLNTKSNVYHCPSDKYYGKTKAGAYMSEAEAKAKGGHADHGKACG